MFAFLLLILTLSLAQSADFGEAQPLPDNTPKSYSIMSTIPSDRTKWAFSYWKPQKRSIVNYAATVKVSDDSHQIVHAKFDIDSPHPTINLDNFKEIASVDCRASTVQLSFYRQKDAKEATKIWAKFGPELHILLGHEHRCLGVFEIFVASVTRVQQIGEYLFLQTVQKPVSSVFQDYTIDIARHQIPKSMDRNVSSTKIPLPNADPDQQLRQMEESALKNDPLVPPSDNPVDLQPHQQNQLAKRGFFSSIGDAFKDIGHGIVDTAKNVGHTVKEVGSDVIHGDFKEAGHDIVDGVKTGAAIVATTAKNVGHDLKEALTWNLDKSSSIPLNINYDAAAKKVKVHDIPLLRSPWADLDCIDCHTRGTAQLEIKIKVVAVVVTEYDLRLNGSFFANMDFDLLLKKTKNTFVYRKTVAALPLTPVAVPGVFSFGPELFLDLGVSYSITEDINLQFGFDFNIPFDLHVRSKGGIKGDVENVNNNQPKQHPSAHGHRFNHTKDMQFGLGAHLIPGVGFDLNIANDRLLGVAFVFDNSLGALVNMGAFTKCKEDKVDVSLYHEHSIAFEAKAWLYTKRINLYDTGKLEIPCPFCSKCPSVNAESAALSPSAPFMKPVNLMALPNSGGHDKNMVFKDPAILNATLHSHINNTETH